MPLYFIIHVCVRACGLYEARHTIIVVIVVVVGVCRFTTTTTTLDDNTTYINNGIYFGLNSPQTNIITVSPLSKYILSVAKLRHTHTSPFTHVCSKRYSVCLRELSKSLLWAEIELNLSHDGLSTFIRINTFPIGWSIFWCFAHSRTHTRPPSLSLSLPVSLARSFTLWIF